MSLIKMYSKNILKFVKAVFRAEALLLTELSIVAIVEYQ